MYALLAACVLSFLCGIYASSAFRLISSWLIRKDFSLTIRLGCDRRLDNREKSQEGERKCESAKMAVTTVSEPSTSSDSRVRLLESDPPCQMLSLKKFSGDVRPNSNVLVVGKRGSGKTSIARDLVSRWLRRIESTENAGLLFFCSSDSRSIFLDVMRSHCGSTCLETELRDGGLLVSSPYVNATFYQQFDAKALDRFIGGSAIDSGSNDGIKHRLIVASDCPFSATDESCLLSAVEKAREKIKGSSLDFFTTVQQVFDVGYGARRKVDYVFAMHDQNPGLLKNIYACFFGGFSSYENFCTAMNAIELMSCLVNDTTLGETSCNIEEHIFWYRS